MKTYRTLIHTFLIFLKLKLLPSNDRKFYVVPVSNELLKYTKKFIDT